MKEILLRDNLLRTLPIWVKENNIYVDFNLPFKLDTIECYDQNISTFIEKLQSLGITTIDNKQINSLTNKELCDLLKYEYDVFVLGTEEPTKTYDNEKCDGNSGIKQIDFKHYTENNYILYNKQCYSIDDLIDYFKSKKIDILNKHAVGQTLDFMTRVPFQELSPETFDEFYVKLLKNV